MKTSLWALVIVFGLTTAAVKAFAGDDTDVLLKIKNGKFTPEILKVPAGKRIQLTVVNEGNGPEEFESPELNREKGVPAHSKAVVLLGPLAKGTYSFLSDFHEDTAQGKIIAE